MKLIVDGQTARLEETSQLVAGSVQVYTIDFEFDDSWDGYAKTAVFEPSFTDAYEQLIVDGQCTIPSEVLAQTGTLRIGVFGTSGTVTKPTMYAPPVYIEEGADTEANTPSSAQQSLYAQLASLVSNASDWVAANGTDTVEHIEDADIHLTTQQSSDIAANTSARHTHENKSILDAITSAVVSGWNGAEEQVADLTELVGVLAEVIASD